MEDCSSSSLSTLLCSESEDHVFLSEEVDGEAAPPEAEEEYSLSRLSNLFVSENEDEHIQMLIQRENNNNTTNNKSIQTPRIEIDRDWLKCARFEAIQWILKMKGFFGFCIQTAYLSISYVDQFLSKRSINSEESWAIRLLSVACLTLAAKMEETEVPALSEFRVEDYNFENKVIQRMELLVLDTLEWRLASVITPFDYVHYFITKLSDESTFKDLVSRTVEHVVAIVKEVNTMDQRPSTIAAAAVLAALSKGLSRIQLELKMSCIASCGSFQNDDVFCCYNRMMELEMDQIKTPQFVVTPDISLVYSGSTDDIEDCSLTSASRNKRRRLTFHNLNQNPDLLIEKKLQ